MGADASGPGASATRGAAPAPVLSSGTLGWITAGVLGVSLFLLLALPQIQNRDSSPAAPRAGVAAPAPAPAGNASAVDLSSMTPREAADRLFDRIVMASETGDSVQMVSFLPMGIAAYDRARPLDADGLFHLSLLQRLALRFDQALATAEGALATQPQHLLSLHAAAEAAKELGDTGRAREYFSRFVEHYDAEIGSSNPDYQVHERLLPAMREDARAWLDDAGG